MQPVPLTPVIRARGAALAYCTCTGGTLVVQQPERTMANLEMATTDLRPADAGAPDEAAEVQALARRGAVGPGPDAARSMRALVILDRTAGRSKMSWRINLEVAALVWRLRRRRGAPRP